MIIHIFGNGYQYGGTPKHVLELASLFPEIEHIFTNTIDLESNLKHDIKQIHIHSLLLQNNNLDWDVIPMLQKFLSMNKVRLVWTIHDYQFLIPDAPNLFKEEFLLKIPFVHPYIYDLFNISNLIIFPSQRLFDNYEATMSFRLPSKCIVTPHCDVSISELVPSPRVINKIIRIAFVGYYFHVKGHFLFDQMCAEFQNYREHTIEYHIIGQVYQPSEHINLMKQHGVYKDDELVEKIESLKIDVICHFSLAEETYCYALTRTIQSQLPILYIKRGAFTERLKNNEYYVGFEYGYQIKESLYNLLDKLISNQNERIIKPISNFIEKTNWYKTNYLP